LLAKALEHIFAHFFAYEAVGVKGGAIGSVVMRFGQDELFKAAQGLSREECQSIVDDLTYDPGEGYWDPFWQPLFRISDGTYLLSPGLVQTSSAERNLIVMLNRNRQKKRYYDAVSYQKEAEQLAELRHLFDAERVTLRERVPVPRRNGSLMTDIDLLIYDSEEHLVLLVHAKWLVRPDNVAEVLSKDQEIEEGIQVARQASERIEELGPAWLCDILKRNVGDKPVEVKSIVVNRDFLPGGWVYDERIPVVDLHFARKFFQTSGTRDLRSFYAAAMENDESLAKLHPIAFAYDEMEFGEYTFELPTIERRWQ
jgi:hypothetical protein